MVKRILLKDEVMLFDSILKNIRKVLYSTGNRGTALLEEKDGVIMLSTQSMLCILNEEDFRVLGLPLDSVNSLRCKKVLNDTLVLIGNKISFSIKKIEFNIGMGVDDLVEGSIRKSSEEKGSFELFLS